jgi:hypothetical protein
VSGFLDGALRAHADGDLCAEAAAGLLIAGRWPDRDDFAGRFITMAASPGSGIQVAVVDWPAAAAALGTGLPCSGGLSELAIRVADLRRCGFCCVLVMSGG